MSLGKSNSISAIYMQLQRWNNFYNNKVVFGRLNSNEKKLITDNAKYKNKYKGKKKKTKPTQEIGERAFTL